MSTSRDVRLSLGVPLAHAAGTDVGKVRDNNEDAHGALWLPDGSLLVTVCDGMGGHEAGEVASAMAVKVVEASVAGSREPDPRATLYHALMAANEAILSESSAGGRRGMGTTAIVALVKGREVHVGLVGDSRLYHVRHGQVIDRTVDHTRVQGLVDRGEISEEEARQHPEAGMLTRALGHARMSNGKPFEPEVFATPLETQDGDALVLCSDGLHDLAWDWEIGATVAGEPPSTAVAQLLDLALQRGAHDNVTVAVVTYGATASPYAEPGAEPAVPAPAPPSDAKTVPPDDDHGPEAELGLVVGAFLLGLAVWLVVTGVGLVVLGPTARALFGG